MLKYERLQKMLQYVQFICQSTLFVQQVLFTDYRELDCWSLIANTWNLVYKFQEYFSTLSDNAAKVILKTWIRLLIF